jgi:hypothetical protein
MGRLSSKLRSVGDGVGFWCPGCESVHSVNKAWHWDGNVDAPTISPSILVTTGHHVSGHESGKSCWCSYRADRIAKGDDPGPFQCERCHSFVRSGMIEFLTDCTHKLAGQTVPVPDWPYAEGEYGGC